MKLSNTQSVVRMLLMYWIGVVKRPIPQFVHSISMQMKTSKNQDLSFTFPKMSTVHVDSDASIKSLSREKCLYFIAVWLFLSKFMEYLHSPTFFVYNKPQIVRSKDVYFPYQYGSIFLSFELFNKFHSILFKVICWKKNLLFLIQLKKELRWGENESIYP